MLIPKISAKRFGNENTSKRRPLKKCKDKRLYKESTLATYKFRKLFSFPLKSIAIIFRFLDIQTMILGSFQEFRIFDENVDFHDSDKFRYNARI